MAVVLMLLFAVALRLVSWVANDIEKARREYIPCALHEWKAHCLDPDNPGEGFYYACSTCNRMPDGTKVEKPIKRS